MKNKNKHMPDLLNPIAIVKFADIMDRQIGAAIDAKFQENGWELHLIEENGYQVFFGEGVQVDNSYEYGFPHLVELDDIIIFAHQFYESHLLETHE